MLSQRGMHPFLDHRPGALTEPVVDPKLALSCCVYLDPCRPLFWPGIALRGSEGAEGCLGLRSRHGLSCKGCVAAACLPNALALSLKGHSLCPY